MRRRRASGSCGEHLDDDAVAGRHDGADVVDEAAAAELRHVDEAAHARADVDEGAVWLVCSTTPSCVCRPRARASSRAAAAAAPRRARRRGGAQRGGVAVVRREQQPPRADERLEHAHVERGARARRRAARRLLVGRQQRVDAARRAAAAAPPADVDEGAAARRAQHRAGERVDAQLVEPPRVGRRRRAEFFLAERPRPRHRRLVPLGGRAERHAQPRVGDLRAEHVHVELRAERRRRVGEQRVIPGNRELRVERDLGAPACRRVPTPGTARTACSCGGRPPPVSRSPREEVASWRVARATRA